MKKSFISPVVTSSALYNQSGFVDLTESDVGFSSGFSREHDSHYNVHSGIEIPITFDPARWMGLQSIVYRMSRDIDVTEESVPYESDFTGLFDEEYGVRHLNREVAPYCFNIVRYNPFYYLAGRHSAGNGRDAFAVDTEQKHYGGERRKNPL